jgi:hypothetical protein
MFPIEDLNICIVSRNIFIKNINLGHNFDDIHQLSVKRGKPSKEILNEIWQKKVSKSLRLKRDRRLKMILD